jgi:Protein of unknown function (DUF3309)
MSLAVIALILIVLTLVGAIPVWSYSRNWGYAPSGVIGVYLLAMFSLLLLGRI